MCFYFFKKKYLLFLLIINSYAYGGLDLVLLDQRTQGKVCLQWSFYGSKDANIAGIHEVAMHENADYFYLTKSNYRKRVTVNHKKHVVEIVNCVRSFLVFGYNGKLIEYIIEYKKGKITVKQSFRVILKMYEGWLSQLPYKSIEQAYNERVIPSDIDDMRTAFLYMRGVKTNSAFHVVAAVFNKRHIQNGFYQ
ncbi:MAG: hypothetical protein QS748_05830 [Candidatus Endonucleobacter bathymodioli]|uniref:Uncharacterized protein n=1 Tax=Candidatus Endonucleibacter bathymodioli TaxID=539814 RepID=A0AA90NL52_9GAMM|nr:hypothetical protein [Candidatus Endonucleobacter bathymodioli]